MERTLTAIAAGLWVGPLLALGAIYLYLTISPQTGGSDHDIANSMMTMLAGLLAGIAGFVAAWYIVRAYVPSGSLRYMQWADGVAIAAILVWAYAAWSQTVTYPPPYYEGSQGVLDVEIRAPMEMHDGNPADPDIVVFLGQGDARKIEHPEFVRRDGDYIIVPVEMEISRHRGWSVVAVHGQGGGISYRYWFDLGMPDRPEGALPWSDWIKAVPKKEYEVTDKVTVRYRWVLKATNQVRVYQP